MTKCVFLSNKSLSIISQIVYAQFIQRDKNNHELIVLLIDVYLMIRLLRQ